MVGPEINAFIKLIFAALAVANMAGGIYLIMRPKDAIQRQIEFYRRINRRMEPLSWEREVRSTWVMGIVAFVYELSLL